MRKLRSALIYAALNRSCILEQLIFDQILFAPEMTLKANYRLSMPGLKSGMLKTEIMCC